MLFYFLVNVSIGNHTIPPPPLQKFHFSVILSLKKNWAFEIPLPLGISQGGQGYFLEQHNRNLSDSWVTWVLIDFIYNPTVQAIFHAMLIFFFFFCITLVSLLAVVSHDEAKWNERETFHFASSWELLAGKTLVWGITKVNKIYFNVTPHDYIISSLLWPEVRLCNTWLIKKQVNFNTTNTSDHRPFTLQAWVLKVRKNLNLHLHRNVSHERLITQRVSGFKLTYQITFWLPLQNSLMKMPTGGISFCC